MITVTLKFEPDEESEDLLDDTGLSEEAFMALTDDLTTAVESVGYLVGNITVRSSSL